MQFIEVAEALETLADDDKRAVYDRYGEEGVKQQAQGGGGGGGANFGRRGEFSRFFGFSFFLSSDVIARRL